MGAGLALNSSKIQVLLRTQTRTQNYGCASARLRALQGGLKDALKDALKDSKVQIGPPL